MSGLFFIIINFISTHQSINAMNYNLVYVWNGSGSFGTGTKGPSEDGNDIIAS